MNYQYNCAPFNDTILTNMALTLLFRSTLVACIVAVCTPCAAYSPSDECHTNGIHENHLTTSEPIAFIVEAEANGFMCPFLTPIFMKELEQRGAISVIKDDQLRVHVSFPADSNITADDLIRIAENVGYEKNKIHVTAA